MVTKRESVMVTKKVTKKIYLIALWKQAVRPVFAQNAVTSGACLCDVSVTHS